MDTISGIGKLTVNGNEVPITEALTVKQGGLIAEEVVETTTGGGITKQKIIKPMLTGTAENRDNLIETFRQSPMKKVTAVYQTPSATFTLPKAFNLGEIEFDTKEGTFGFELTSNEKMEAEYGS